MWAPYWCIKKSEKIQLNITSKCIICQIVMKTKPCVLRIDKNLKAFAVTLKVQIERISVGNSTFPTIRNDLTY